MLNLLSILEVVEHLASISPVYVFFRKKLPRKFRLRQKLVFLIKQHVFGLYTTTFTKNLPT